MRPYNDTWPDSHDKKKEEKNQEKDLSFRLPFCPFQGRGRNNETGQKEEEGAKEGQEGFPTQGVYPVKQDLGEPFMQNPWFARGRVGENILARENSLLKEDLSRFEVPPYIVVFLLNGPCGNEKQKEEKQIEKNKEMYPFSLHAKNQLRKI